MVKLSAVLVALVKSSLNMQIVWWMVMREKLEVLGRYKRLSWLRSQLRTASIDIETRVITNA